MAIAEINEYLAQPWSLGKLKLKNRVVMASLTRNRNIIPDQVNVDYYEQRVGAGLILSEGVLIEPQGTEWTEAPGIWNKKQIIGWKKITDVVHKKDGIIFAQLWHLGRVANSLHNAGISPPAPSKIRANAGKFRLLKGEPGYSTPEAIENPKEYIELYKQAAKNAKEAGFDGVELHCANGYLVQQFFESQSNKRDDEYGGNIINRTRFALEIIDVLSEVYPPEQIGVKVSPCGGPNDVGEVAECIRELYSYLITQLDQRNIGYVQLNRYIPEFDTTKRGTDFDLTTFIPLFKNTKPIFNGKFDAKLANEFIKDGKATAVSFGRDFIANPDLAFRLIHNLDIAQPINYSSFYLYDGDDKHAGYSDYPNHPKNNERQFIII